QEAQAAAVLLAGVGRLAAARTAGEQPVEAAGPATFLAAGRRAAGRGRGGALRGARRRARLLVDHHRHDAAAPHANGVRHTLLDALLGDVAADGVRHLLGAGFAHHPAGGVVGDRLDLSATLEGAARALAVVADALGVHPGALAALGHGVGHLVADLFLHHPADGVGHLL